MEIKRPVPALPVPASEAPPIRVRVSACQESHPFLRACAARTVRHQEGRDLCGFVLKEDSPTCGMARVRRPGIEYLLGRSISNPTPRS